MAGGCHVELLGTLASHVAVALECALARDCAEQYQLELATERDRLRVLLEMTRYRAGMRLVVDLTEVTFLDAVGEDLLSFFGRFGVDFIAETSYSRYICERLHLQVAVREPSDGITSGPSTTNRVQRNRRAHRPLVNY